MSPVYWMILYLISSVAFLTTNIMKKCCLRVPYQFFVFFSSGCNNNAANIVPVIKYLLTYLVWLYQVNIFSAQAHPLCKGYHPSDATLFIFVKRISIDVHLWFWKVIYGWCEENLRILIVIYWNSCGRQHCIRTKKSYWSGKLMEHGAFALTIYTVIFCNRDLHAKSKTVTVSKYSYSNILQAVGKRSLYHPFYYFCKCSEWRNVIQYDPL